MTLNQWLEQATNAINAAGHSDTARLDAELLLAHVLQCNRSVFYAFPERELTSHNTMMLAEYLARREQGEPVAYIIGEKEFWSLPLWVNCSTLIPRPDTEILVEATLQVISDNATFSNSPVLLDIGTGTGAIALALASELCDWCIFASDYSWEAVQLAEKNRQRHALINACVFVSNWCEAIAPHSVDILVSNPPYIELNDSHLQQGDVRFEPSSALTSGETGLDDIQHIIQQAQHVLKPQGFILLEHGYNQALSVSHLLKPAFSGITTVQDLSGNERVTFGQLRNLNNQC